MLYLSRFTFIANINISNAVADASGAATVTENSYVAIVGAGDVLPHIQRGISKQAVNKEFTLTQQTK